MKQPTIYKLLPSIKRTKTGGYSYTICTNQTDDTGSAVCTSGVSMLKTRDAVLSMCRKTIKRLNAPVSSRQWTVKSKRQFII